ncbi:MAG: hypothetical protein HXY20_05130, partial [Acidobacteria bacterium]|nr:hypothetical protein [Acidobacteriota bacterium]
PNPESDGRRANTVLRAENRAAKGGRDAGEAQNEADRHRSQVLGILILAALMLAYACLRYCLRSF